MDDPADRDDRPRDGLTRRDFFRTVGAGGLATGVLGAGAARGDEPPGPRILGPGPVPIRLDVDGAARELAVEPRVTLLDALRDGLGVTGPKPVCDRAACGACTVLLDGLPVYACSVLAVEARGREVRTVAALAAGEALHPVQQAFCDRDGLMCGYCTPGLVTSSAALATGSGAPDGAAARRALDGHICRCGTYLRVLDAVAAAAGAKR